MQGAAPEVGQPVHGKFSASIQDSRGRKQEVHGPGMAHATITFKHRGHVLGAASPDKDEARAAPLEMPEMLDEVCLVAQTLTAQLCCMQHWRPYRQPLPYTAPPRCYVSGFLEGSGDAAHTPRRKF